MVLSIPLLETKFGSGSWLSEPTPTCQRIAASAEGRRAATIKFPRTTLGELPSASDVTFPGLFAWSPVSTTTLTNTLGIDKGLWGTWRNRRLTPAPMPETWFRRAAGRPLIYRVDQILVWLAARHGERLDTLTPWRLSLLRDLDTEVSDPAEVKVLVRLYAQAVGPKVDAVSFTPAGFQAYLASLLLYK